MTPSPAALLPLVLLLLALAGRIRAQEDGSPNQITSTSSKVWAAVAFVNHGETTPFLRSASPVLTPSGAQQLYRQGAAFRERYLAPSTARNASSSSSSEAATIKGLSQNAIDNAQLRILAQTDEWVVGGAVAFMQALYPPNSKALREAAGGQTLAKNADDSDTTSYPLDGYQYPKIETLASTDANSVGIQGHVGCPAWQHASTTNLTTNPTLKGAAKKSADFYTKLFRSGPLQGALAAADANLFNAYDIYNLVRYEYTHNATVAANLANANATLERLAADAFAMERAKSDPGSSTANDTASVALTIAGRTLAHLVADQMHADANRTTGRVQRLTLLFGSFQPLMALFSVAGLLTRDNVLSTPVGNVTAPGAAIVFELIEQSPKGAAGFPKPEDLSVRFVFRPTADASDTFQEFSLFDSGNGDRSIPYLAFRDKMTSIGRDAADWCRVCKPSTGPASAWCQEGSADGGDNGGDNGGGARMRPAVAGVIGAVIMGALVALAGLALYGLGGFRLRRRSRDGAGCRGAEKRDGDPDVRYGSGGEAQERIGSWEMKGQPKSESSVQQQRTSFDDDAGSDVEGAAPVRTREVL
ncbi:hypothetical protein MY11210_005484 [Beauveria gryllotalpidicola]